MPRNYLHSLIVMPIGPEARRLRVRLWLLNLFERVCPEPESLLSWQETCAWREQNWGMRHNPYDLQGPTRLPGLTELYHVAFCTTSPNVPCGIVALAISDARRCGFKVLSWRCVDHGNHTVRDLGADTEDTESHP